MYAVGKVGGSVILKCSGEITSWNYLRSSAKTVLLTTGTFIIYRRKYDLINPNYNLRIKNLNMNDAGRYVCGTGRNVRVDKVSELIVLGKDI